MQAQPIGQPCEVVEDADDVREFEACLIVEAQIPKWLPILFDHQRGGGAELFRQSAQRVFSWCEESHISPSLFLQRLHQLVFTVLDTQKLCVALRSIVAVLGR